MLERATSILLLNIKKTNFSCQYYLKRAEMCGVKEY